MSATACPQIAGHLLHGGGGTVARFAHSTNVERSAIGSQTILSTTESSRQGVHSRRRKGGECGNTIVIEPTVRQPRPQTLANSAADCCCDHSAGAVPLRNAKPPLATQPPRQAARSNTEAFWTRSSQARPRFRAAHVRAPPSWQAAQARRYGSHRFRRFDLVHCRRPGIRTAGTGGDGYGGKDRLTDTASSSGATTSTHSRPERGMVAMYKDSTARQVRRVRSNPSAAASCPRRRHRR